MRYPQPQTVAPLSGAWKSFVVLVLAQLNIWKVFIDFLAHDVFSFVSLLGFLASAEGLKNTQPNIQARSNYNPKRARSLPAAAQGVQTIITPQNVTIRYKNPGAEGVCETTPGVNSYSGYIDLDANSHTFFWFFEARNNPHEAPITLWLNGGPGSDSMIGLFQELGPCNITANLTSQVNPYAWNEVSNMLFLSQPLGVGFSYGNEQVGSLNPDTGAFENASFADPQGRYPVINATALDTTDLAAVAAWHVLQGFLGGLPQLDGGITSREFNLWTESYGGHYGPAFYNYFYEQNEFIANGSAQEIQLNFNSLGVGNGIINEAIQSPYYPEFAVNNTYGIKAYNDTVYNHAKFALNMHGGCLDQVAGCAALNRTSLNDYGICTEAENMCRDNVESPYYYYGGRGTYDIRHPSQDPDPPSYFIDYLNQASVQNALGVDLNYTADANNEVYFAFQQTRDFVFPNFLEDLEMLLNNSVRVALFYGDADYICNWFGGEAVSLEVNYIHKEEFAAAGYAPFKVDGDEYGEVRQYGNFSFLRIYEEGHEVPYYQPVAALEMFRRVLLGLDLADGDLRFSANFSSPGIANATHIESFVPLPSSTSSTVASSTSSSASGTATTAAAHIFKS
ncbi:related to carboxypeptidase [Phialocephala subalpina]|uniref:Carboxypeptidase n=1 Tax=Phialocephala subalpina TaxID=576137 RepID=A0A1L7WDW7_9HELO|nr:related to carboxypeptidase [Phialocephala subalpina]